MQKGIEKRLIELNEEHESFRFDNFNSETAHDIGTRLVKAAEKRKAAVAIDICVNGHRLFHYAFEGTAPENERWIERKNNVVRHFCKSSYSVSLFLKLQEKTIEEMYGLDSGEYAPYGGAFPIYVEQNGVIGTITVSGLPDHEDHQLVVDVLTEYFNFRRTCK